MDKPRPARCTSAPTWAFRCLSSRPRAISCFSATAAARQPDSKYFRSWEIAGTSHYDTYSLTLGPKDDGTIDADAAFFDTMINPVTSPYPGIVDCSKPINAGGQTYVGRGGGGRHEPLGHRRHRATARAALAARPDEPREVRGGCERQRARRDRTPQVEAPIATLSGLGQSGTGFCFLFGTTAPFDAAKLAALYPTHAAFVKAWNAATDQAVKAGFILAVDAKNLKAAAAQSTIGGA